VKPTILSLPLIIVLFLFAHVAFGQKSLAGVDQNAAVRYLMALGWFSPPDRAVMNELAAIDHLEDAKKLSPKAQEYLKNGKINDFGSIFNVIRLLKAGAQCSTCVFNPDKQFFPDDSIPPYKRLREMVRVVCAIGALKALDGKHQEALDLFKAVYRFGQHLEQEGLLISGMIGVDFRKRALSAMVDLRAMTPAETVIVDLKAFLNTIPKPPMDIPCLILGGKNCFAGMCQWYKNNPEAFGTNLKLVKTATGSTIVIASDESGGGEKPMIPVPQSCAANQRVIIGATEMLQMDYGELLPATISANLQGALVRLGYLKSFPECPEKGQYNIDLQAKGKSNVCCCSVHQTVDDIEEAAGVSANRVPTGEELAEWKSYVSNPDFEEHISQGLKVFDAALKMESKRPDFQKRLEQLQHDTENASKFFIKTSFPDFNIFWKNQSELEAKIEMLLK
jgi:hypothetical protein